MKVLRLVAQNIKKIRAIDITPPDDPLVVITGKNDQGKSSALDAIQLALDAESLKKSVTVPLRTGTHHGHIALDLGEGRLVQVEISRTYTENGNSYLTVWADGEEIKSPQAFLDALKCRLSFDPLAFAKMEDGKQRATLLNLVHLDVDLPSLDAQYADAFEKRTQVNRDLKQQQAILATLPVPAADLPATELSATDILAAIQAAQDTRLHNATQRQQLTALRDEATTAKKSLDDLEQTIRDLETRLETLRNEHAEKRKAYAALLSRGKELATTVRTLIDPDLTLLQDQLSTLQQRNEAIRSGQQYRSQAAEVARLRQESERLTAQLDQIKQTKDTALRQAKFPIEGLGFSEEGVTFDGLPFHQASTSQQLRASLAIAMALNPTLKVLRVSDGNLLDEDNMELLRSVARERDYQIWIETVGESDKVGIQIEDGLVKGAPIPDLETRRPRKRETMAPSATTASPQASRTPPATSPSSKSMPHPTVQGSAQPPLTGLAAVAPPLANPTPEAAFPPPPAPETHPPQPTNAPPPQPSLPPQPPAASQQRPPTRTPVYAKRTSAKPLP